MISFDIVPFELPQRRSSLAFFHLMDQSTTTEEVSRADSRNDLTAENEAHALRCNVGKKRTAETLLTTTATSQTQVAQLQRVLHTAQANLQLDIHFAASPTGSIESRLPYEKFDGTDQQNQWADSNVPRSTWRYSTGPSNLFPAQTTDVREPLPQTSPALPAIEQPVLDVGCDVTPVEPTSSGFASPVTARPEAEVEVETEYHGLNLPPLPCSSPPDIDMEHDGGRSTTHSLKTHERDISDLTQPMTGLKVGSRRDGDDDRSTISSDDSPITDHLRRISGFTHTVSFGKPNPPNSIFLSQSAKAAAESARIKRRLLKKPSEQQAGINDVEPGHQTTLVQMQETLGFKCPNPQLHRYSATSPCPDPSAHTQVHSINMRRSFAEVMDVQTRFNDFGNFAPGSKIVTFPENAAFGNRTTAAGSPMPFAKRTFSPHMTGDLAPGNELDFGSPLTLSPHRHAQPRDKIRRPRHRQQPSEHFRPGWSYASNASSNRPRPSANLYSFSTAAAKATGESAAPDKRIRDSYRTDTLTPLAHPPGRFRKTGITTSVRSMGPRPYHHRRNEPKIVPDWRLPSEQGCEPLSWQRRFNSSPPLPSEHYMSAIDCKKRGHGRSDMPKFDIAEEDSAVSTGSSARSSMNDGNAQIDEDRREAIRTSLFGPNTPECLQGGRHGIKELSPNVSVWRKGLSGGPHYRKKRRPSYWDGDLEEVRMSPAGVGGMASSPTISKRSMAGVVEDVTAGGMAAPNENVIDVEDVASFGESEMDDIDDIMGEAKLADAVE